MRRAAVTGGAGFIGAHLVRRLVDLGVEAVILDNLKRGSPRNLQAVGVEGVRLIEGDIRNYQDVCSAVRGCDVVFHLAAQSNVMGAADDPDYSVTTNVDGTVCVLRAAAAAGVPRVVFTSSREVYGDPKVLPVSEEQPLLPKNSYGASKVAGEAYCHSFAATSPLDVAILRLANVYGPGDSGRVIPLWLTAAQSGHDLNVYGGEQVIDFLWVGTAVQALIHAGERGLPGPTNIGSGTATRITDLADRILQLTHSKSRIVRTPAREIEVARFVADTARMRALGLMPDADPLQHLADIIGAYRPDHSEARSA